VGCLVTVFSFEGFGLVAESHSPVAGRVEASHEVRASLECYECQGSSSIGFSTPALRSLFPKARRFSSDIVPPYRKSKGSSSYEVVSSSEYGPPQTRLLTVARMLLPGSFAPLRDLSSQSPHHGSLPRSPSFRPQRFSRSRRLSPLSAVRAYFIPLPRAGFPLQGFSPLPSRFGSSPSRALLSFTTSAYRR